MFDRLAVAVVSAVLAVGVITLGASLITTRDNAAGPCPRELSEAEAIDTSAPGLLPAQRAWGIAGGAPGRVRAGVVAAFAHDTGATGPQQYVITIDPATGARCRLLRFGELKPIRANVTGLDWSPSGDALAIGVENPEGPDGSTGQLLILTSTRLLRVWSGPGQNPHFDWAPDGRSIAVWTPYGDPTPNVRIVFADGSPDRIIAVQPALGLKWSPDGSRWIVAAGEFRAWTLSVVDLSDGRMTPMQPGIFYSLSPEGWIDNERVLLRAMPQDRTVAGYLDVPLATPASYSVIQLPQDALALDGFVAFSPDRRRAAYTTPVGDVEIANLAGEPDSAPIHVDAIEGGILGLAWAPDGSKLVFTTFPSGPTAENTTWVVNADGTDLRQIDGAGASAQDDPWQPVPVR